MGNCGRKRFEPDGIQYILIIIVTQLYSFY